MSAIQKFQPSTGLSSKLFSGERKLIDDLVQEANRRLEELRPSYEVELSAIVDEIVDGWGAGVNRDELPFAPLYDLACKILDLTSVTTGRGIETAAFSLCDLVDWCARHNRWDWPRIDLHISAIRLLQLDGAIMTELEHAQIGDGLLRLMAPVRTDVSEG